MGEEVKIDETKTLATDEDGKAVESPEGGSEAAADDEAGDGAAGGDGGEAAE